MGRMIGIVVGAKGNASRLGTAESGVKVAAQGWHVGVVVRGQTDKDEADLFAIYATRGSDKLVDERFIGTVRLDQDGDPIFQPAHNSILCDNCGCIATRAERTNS